MFSTNADFNQSNQSSSVKFMGIGQLKVVSIKAAEQLDDKNQRRITITFKPVDKNINGLVSKSFWLSTEDVVSKSSGNNQVINAYGETGYPNADGQFSEYFNQESIRNAMVGEGEFTKFLKVIYNFKKAQTFNFQPESFKQLVKTGDVTGFTEGQTSILDKVVNGMVGIKDGKYTTLYPEIVFGWVKDASENFQKFVDKDKNSQYPLAKQGEVFVVEPFKIVEDVKEAEALVKTTAQTPEDLPF